MKSVEMNKTNALRYGLIVALFLLVIWSLFFLSLYRFITEGKANIAVTLMAPVWAYCTAHGAKWILLIYGVLFGKVLAPSEKNGMLTYINSMYGKFSLNEVIDAYRVIEKRGFGEKKYIKVKTQGRDIYLMEDLLRGDIAGIARQLAEAGGSHPIGGPATSDDPSNRNF